MIFLPSLVPLKSHCWDQVCQRSTGIETSSHFTLPYMTHLVFVNVTGRQCVPLCRWQTQTEKGTRWRQINGRSFWLIKTPHTYLVQKLPSCLCFPACPAEENRLSCNFLVFTGWHNVMFVTIITLTSFYCQVHLLTILPRDCLDKLASTEPGL